MARSSFIYVVKKHPSRAVLGTFTVKHECLTSIERNLSPFENISVWRYINNSMLTLPNLVGEGHARDVLKEMR